MFLRLVERASQHRAPGPLECGRHLVGRHLADQQEQCRIAGLQRLADAGHECVVDPDIRQSAADRARRGTDRGAGQRHHEQKTDQRAPEHAGHGTCLDRMKQLVQPDMPFGAFRDHHGVAELDEIFALHRQQLLANLVGLCFRREFDDKQIGHQYVFLSCLTRRRQSDMHVGWRGGQLRAVYHRPAVNQSLMARMVVSNATTAILPPGPRLVSRTSARRVPRARAWLPPAHTQSALR